MTANVTSDARAVPPYVPRFGRTKPVVAVVAANVHTELTDYVVPYGVLAESGAAHVLALATKPGPIQMYPALQIEPQATVAEFDERFPDGADYAIVPAVHHSDDPALLRWVRAQADKGATIVGICDGVWVVANAGLLKGRKAVGHWYSFNKLEKAFPQTQWIRNARYIADGKVITTTGVTASIPVSLALVEAIADGERATTLARKIGVRDWNATHQSDRFRLTPRHMSTAAGNWVSFWAREDVGIPVGDGVDEVALALVADAYSRTYRSQAFSVAPVAGRIFTRRGLAVLPDKSTGATTGIDRTVNLVSSMPPVSALDAALRDIGKVYGEDTAAFVALQLEYPHQ